MFKIGRDPAHDPRLVPLQEPYPGQRQGARVRSRAG